MRNSEIAISIKNLTKYYGDFKALDNVQLRPSGDFFAFLPQRRRQTTTINVITGLFEL